MSGGSWDYVSFRFEEVGERLVSEASPERRALGRRVLLIAEALHDIEWADSGDTLPGSELPAINRALMETGPVDVFKEAADACAAACRAVLDALPAEGAPQTLEAE